MSKSAVPDHETAGEETSRQTPSGQTSPGDTWAQRRRARNYGRLADSRHPGGGEGRGSEGPK